MSRVAGGIDGLEPVFDDGSLVAEAGLLLPATLMGLFCVGIGVYSASLTAFAAATSTTASLETLRDAAGAGEAHKPARSAIQPYRATLEQLWQIEEVPA